MKLSRAMLAGLGLGVALLVSRRASATRDVSPRRAPPEAPPAARGAYTMPHYPPHSADAILLFTSAARVARVPDTWAQSPALHEILAKESNGWVGIPNYQFGKNDPEDASWRAQWPHIWQSIRDGNWRDMLVEPYKSKPHGEQSSATGLGQLTRTNLVTHDYYPTGLAGIGNALEEAVGMIRYIRATYGTPEKAFEAYGKGREGY